MRSTSPQGGLVLTSLFRTLRLPMAGRVSGGDVITGGTLMHIQDSHWASASAIASGGTVGAAASGNGRGPGEGSRTAPLRVDAQRNLEHVLRAAREVFGELGYGAPMEDVARRARVGVGTVYRRFPSKDVLVRRIAEEETSRLTDQARAALGQEDEPWSALSRFLRTSVASGAGRLLPPQVLRVGVAEDGAEADEARVPQQRSGLTRAAARRTAAGARGGVGGRGGGRRRCGGTARGGRPTGGPARAAGELRADVTVADVLLVIATAAPSLPDAAQQAAASSRLLDILLEGLRSRPA